MVNGKNSLKLPKGNLISKDEIAKLLEFHFNNEIVRQIHIAKTKLTPFPKGVSFCKIKITYNTSSHIYHSWGGYRNKKPFLSFALHSLINKLSNGESAFHFEEYATFENDPKIGQFTGSIEKYISALVAHELSHAIQYTTTATMHSDSQVFGYMKAEVRKTHGYAWQHIYGVLRKYAVNDLS